jgi:hypothetical protein
MVGPPAEATATVRHVSRMFVAAASLSVPLFTVVLRKGYGLGAQAMAGGHFHASFFTVSWPTGEFGGMNLEGAVRLGMKKQLEAVTDPAAREEMFQGMVAMAYERGKAINMAALLEIDAVIDPAETRAWLVRGLRSAPPHSERRERRLRRYVVSERERVLATCGAVRAAGSSRRTRESTDPLAAPPSPPPARVPRARSGSRSRWTWTTCGRTLTSAFRTRFPMYTITVVGNVPLPRDLATATDDNVEDILRSAATHLGRDGVEIRRVSSILGGSCIACVDVVAYVGGTALLVARPALY